MKVLLCLLAFLPALSFAQGTEDDSFHFNFALASKGIYLQTEFGTPSYIEQICGPTGKLCSCEAQDSSGRVLETTDSDHISFDTSARYMKCSFVGNQNSIAKVRVYKGRITSPAIDVKNQVSLGDLLGSSLDANRVRSIYRYQCDMKYLQKDGTTTQGFDCSARPVACDPDGNTRKNFCLLTSQSSFHLFADNYSNNFTLKPADSLYAGGNLCGMQIKRYDCATENGAPTLDFGLYAEPVGYWNTQVKLDPAPDMAAAFEGYAAKVNPATGECPPGLVKKAFFRLRVVTSDILPSHNMPNFMIATEVRSAEAPPPPFAIGKLSGGSGGNCDGSKCSIPNSYVTAGAKPPQSYPSAGETPFCVIPNSILPMQGARH